MLICVKVADARRKKEVAGSVTDGVYQDNRFGFKMTSGKLADRGSKKDEDNFRLILTQKNYGSAARLSVGSGLYLHSPPGDLCGYVQSEPVRRCWTHCGAPFKSKQKKEIMSEFEFLSQPEIIPKG